MDREHIKELKHNPEYIPEIYNYCDRWCERCSFTSQCINYVLSKNNADKISTHDISNEIFWQKLEETFKLTIDMLKEFALRNGINLYAIDINEKKLDTCLSEKSSITRDAKDYILLVDQWFKSEKNIFQEKEEEIKLRISLGIGNCNIKEDTLNAEESVKIIHWYQHQIYVKLMRATENKKLKGEIPGDKIRKEINGSAKVALLGIDRSIAAWNYLREYFTEQNDKILDLLIHLDLLRKKIDIKFPDARSFIRPGFDE